MSAGRHGINYDIFLRPEDNIRRTDHIHDGYHFAPGERRR